MTRINIPLFVALAASLLAAIDARTNTLPHQRMIRKRTPGSFDALPRWAGLHDRADLLPGFGGNDSDPSGTSSSAVASRTTSAAATSSAATSSRATTSAAAEQTTSAAATSSTPVSSTQTTQSASTTSGGLLDSLTGILGGTQTTSTVSSTSSTTSSAPSTIATSSAAPTTSEPPKPTPTPTLNIATPPVVSANSAGPSFTVVTSMAPEASASQQAAQQARTAKITKNTIISLVVIASCIGGAVAIWTVIRKWKLSPSEKFDDRMQPIDWAPAGGATGMREETADEKRHRRAGSAGSHGSFTSGGVGQSEVGHGTGARSVYSDNAGHNMQHGQDFPPPHDFTAGATNYGQYYQGQQQQYGYADLQRGPSVTESSYSHGASVTRGLSYSRGHGGYDAQAGAGGVPPLPNPYGGGYEYEDYGRQQPQGQAQGQYRGY